MFKKGKMWCVAAAATASMVVGISAIQSDVSADEVASSTDNSAAIISNVDNVTQGSSVVLGNTDTTVASSADSSATLSADSEVASSTTSNAASEVIASATDTTSNAASEVASSATDQTSSANLNSASSETDKTTSSDSDAASSVTDETSNTDSDAVPSDDSINDVLDALIMSDAIKNGLVNEDGQTYYYVNGQKVSGKQTVNNSTYYFDDYTYRMKTDFFYTDNNEVYYFGSDGKMYKSQFYSNWGNVYYFGDNGSRYTDDFYSNWNNVYYFGSDGARYTDKFYTNWGSTYYFGNDGVRSDNQFYSNWGNVYYFGSDGARYTNNFYSNWGNVYYFGSDGARYTNNFYSNWGSTYYFGSDGARYTNKFYTNWGNIYAFDGNGALKKNQVADSGDGYLRFNNDGVLTFHDSSLSTANNTFMNKILYGAITEWVNHKILPSLTAAQAIIESGWGNSDLTTMANNLFGIKGSYNGNSITMATGEYYNGQYVTVNAQFRAYASYAESMSDHSQFLLDNSRYANLIGVTDSNIAAMLIQQDGYATSPTYAKTLMNTMNYYDLTSWNWIAFYM
ncbi:putative mannosyl-glycoprotein endo-beta-N-acetylglucosamidase [Paucilactobacillus oligofermentans DSM 15707 = LMG 22743]|uniref:Putative mannosyl-glycoprotein endo-beta-N-acetylglucosamidase n=2 Tax=Paucilactobacillus oligofermentans TaxID=293371 RepID=A0A0R1RDL6_9LACO|nr:putative mannosyl-glycoprotein endo-beta-N-acetylglucosamidase [Paucilactobacillus oligofermentans DSM 15707 = LMG 22743]